MPPKRTKVSDGSNSVLSTAIATKFVNDTARTRFELAKRTRQAISERGFGFRLMIPHSKTCGTTMTVI